MSVWRGFNSLYANGQPNQVQGPSAYPQLIGGRNPNSDTFASDTYADLIRDEYRDYEGRFQPYERRLMSVADSEALLDEQLSKITANSASRFRQAEQNSALMNQRYGGQQTDRQRNSFATYNDSQRGLAISQAKNMSRLAAEDRRIGILSGASSNRASALNNQG